MNLADITFYTPDKAIADAANASGCRGKASCDTASLDISVTDVIDTLNPLEHIPFVSTLYDELTGSKPSAGAQLAGGALYGGAFGVLVSALNLAFQSETGHDATGAMFASLTGDSTVSVASAATAYKTADATDSVQAAQANLTQEDAILQTPTQEILPPTPAYGKIANLTSAASNQQQRSQDILSLFDAPNAAAHSAYRRAQSLTAPTNSSTALVM